MANEKHVQIAVRLAAERMNIPEDAARECMRIGYEMGFQAAREGAEPPVERLRG